MSRRLRPRLLPTVAAAAALLVLLNLSAWQLRRHTQKNRWLETARAAWGAPPMGDEGLNPAALWHHIELTGRFEGDPHLEGGRERGLDPAYGVLQVFVTAAGDRLLVDRGELLAINRAAALKRLPVVDRLEGQLRPLPEGRTGAAVNPGESPLIWRKNSIGAVHAATPDLLAGVYLRAGEPAAAPSAPEATLSDGYGPLAARHDSLHYAYQWAAIAALLVGLWVWGSLDAGRSED